MLLSMYRGLLLYPPSPYTATLATVVLVHHDDHDHDDDAIPTNIPWGIHSFLRGFLRLLGVDRILVFGC